MKGDLNISIEKISRLPLLNGLEGKFVAKITNLSSGSVTIEGLKIRLAYIMARSEQFSIEDARTFEVVGNRPLNPNETIEIPFSWRFTVPGRYAFYVKVDNRTEKLYEFTVHDKQKLAVNLLVFILGIVLGKLLPW